MMWTIHTALIGFIAIIAFNQFKQVIKPSIYWIALVLKLASGIILGWIFVAFYESGDTIHFFQEAKELASVPFNEYMEKLFEISSYQTTNQPRVVFFTKIISFLALITDGNYWISSLYLSLISFLSSCYFVTKLARLYPSLLKLSILCFLFIPTIIFWSSGILKDTLAYSAVLITVTTILSIYHSHIPSHSNKALTLVAIFILWRIKHYLLITLLLFAGVLFFLQLVKSKKTSTKWLAIAILGSSLIASQFIHPYLNLSRITETLYENNHAINLKTDQEDLLNILIEEPSWSSILREVPLALKTGLFRPSLFDKTSIWGMLHQVENTLLTVLAVLSILLIFKEKLKLDRTLIAASILSVLFLATLLALSTPNFGTLVRYKNAFMPFLFLVSSILPYRYFTSKAS